MCHIYNRFLDIEEAISNCQTGAWQHLLKYRLDMHPCLETSDLPQRKFNCRLCGRRRACHDRVDLFGTGYNSNTLRTIKGFKSDMTEEEKDSGLSHIYKDETDGISATIGPTCMQRLLLYHELRLYQSLPYATII